MKRRTLLTIIGVILAAEVVSGVILHLTASAPSMREDTKLPAFIAWNEATETTQLVPNYKGTYAEVLQSLRQANWLNLKAIFDVELALTDLKPSDDGIVIDENGMRQSATVEEPDMTLLILGDSISFGTLQGKSFPHYVEKFIQDSPEKLNVEVMNASVPSHTTTDALKRLPAFDGLKPDVVAIYLGVNDLYKKRPLAYTPPSYTLTLLGLKLPRTFENAFEKAVLKPLVKLRMAFYTPPAVQNIRQMAKHFNAQGTKVVLIAPMMLTDAPHLTEASKEKLGTSLPQWTADADILKLLNKRFSDALTDLAPKVGADIVNAGDWLMITDNNQNALYDNVHLSSSGAHAFAQYLTLPLRTAVENKYGQMQLEAAYGTPTDTTLDEAVDPTPEDNAPENAEPPLPEAE